MTKYVTDKIGNLIEVDDLVIYGRSSGDNIHHGTVSEVFPESNTIKVRNADTGRNSVNRRSGEKVLVITFLKETNPEYFL